MLRKHVLRISEDQVYKIPFLLLDRFSFELRHSQVEVSTLMIPYISHLLLDLYISINLSVIYLSVIHLSFIVICIHFKSPLLSYKVTLKSSFRMYHVPVLMPKLSKYHCQNPSLALGVCSLDRQESRRHQSSQDKSHRLCGVQGGVHLPNSESEAEQQKGQSHVVEPKDEAQMSGITKGHGNKDLVREQESEQGTQSQVGEGADEHDPLQSQAEERAGLWMGQNGNLTAGQRIFMAVLFLKGKAHKHLVIHDMSKCMVFK